MTDPTSASRMKGLCESPGASALPWAVSIWICICYVFVLPI